MFFIQFLQVTLLGTSHKRIYSKNNIPCWILVYSREWPCRACPTTKYWMNWSKTIKNNTKECTLTNSFFLTKFGSIMKKLWRFYPKHLILTSFRTGHKYYFPRSVTPKIQRPTSWIFNHRYLDMFSHFHIHFRIWIIINKKLKRKWWDDL